VRSLKKDDPKSFDRVNARVRSFLHLDHIEIEYIIHDEPDEDDPEMFACRTMHTQGSSCKIEYYPKFWNVGADRQLRIIIHEHVHTVMTLHDQSVYKIIRDGLHSADQPMAEAYMINTKEHVVEHLEGVLYALLKDKI